MNWSEGDVRVDDANLHYYRRGRGPAVVLAHGALDDGRCWTRVAEALESEYDLIAYDARFHGKSDAPVSGMRRGADDLVGIIEALGLERPYAIGHSMGAGTVAAALATLPGLIRAAVLEDPGWGDAPADPEGAGKFMAAFAGMLSGKSADEIAAMGRSSSPTWHDDEFRPWAESKVRFRGLDEFGKAARGMGEGWQNTVAAFRCPVLLVCGGNEGGGRIVTPEVAARAEELCPTLEVACFAHAGHNVRREAYDEFVSAVTEFLRRN
ncbi:MAG: alpha/beta hydrolase [Acidimicrobiia bacterium]